MKCPRNDSENSSGKSEKLGGFFIVPSEPRHNLPFQGFPIPSPTAWLPVPQFIIWLAVQKWEMYHVSGLFWEKWFPNIHSGTFWEITGMSESLLQINLAVFFWGVLQLLNKHGRCCGSSTNLGLQVTRGRTVAIPCWLDCLHRSHKGHQQQPVHKTTRRRQNRWSQRCLHWVFVLHPKV